MLTGPLRGRRWIVGASTHACWLGSYELEKQRALAGAVSRGDIIYDIGSHVGFYTLLGARLTGPGGRVYAFEPLPRNLALLRRHLDLNRADNVVVFEGVVGSTNGKAGLATSNDPSQGRIADDGDLTVASFALDELVRDKTIPPAKIVKIDVEGAERAVLEGGRAFIEHHRPTLLLATHGSAVRSDCLKFLDRYGYSVRPLDSRSVEDSSEFIAVASHRAV